MSFVKRSVSLRRLSYRSTHPYGGSGARRIVIFLLLLLALILALVLPVRSFLISVTGSAAVHSATDAITAAVNETINEKMRDESYGYEYFVSIQTDSDGAISSVSANMARINTLASSIIKEIIEKTDNGQLDLEIPLGNLLGSSILLGRGPNIPIKIITLSSSASSFRNELVSAGINQSKHQIILEISVSIEVLLPWNTEQTLVCSDVLIAETIIVGKVPQTYLDLSP